MSEKNSSTIKFDKNSELRRSRQTKLFFVFLIFIILILGGFVGFLRKKDIQINQVTIVGTKALDPAFVLATTRKYLNGKYFMIIPKTNTLLLSKPVLQKYLLDHIPSIHTANIRFIEKNSIEINIAEKKPQYVWCNDTCYFVDDEGIIYEPAPEFTDGIFFTFKGGDIEGGPIRQRFISEYIFNELLNLKKSLETLEIISIGMILGDDLTININLMQKIPVNKNARILISRDGTMSSVIHALDLLLKDQVFLSQLATKGSRLEYIDVRIPDKIYYKFNE